MAHVKKMRVARKNELIVRCFEEKMSLIDFFHVEDSKWENVFAMTPDEIDLLRGARDELANYSFLVEDLLEQGYDIIPITSPDYPTTLKANMKRTYAPPLIYTKGNKCVLQEDSVAIVGARNAGTLALEFTDNVVKEAISENKIVVSGFAKGVDQQALDSAMKYNGKSIIVLPQGIMTFASGFKKYYKQVIQGKVVVLSTFFPKAPWSVELAMTRNPVIYGLAREIYVAESSESGGTWAGVMDGLRKGRRIFVRYPRANEKNANNVLIHKGAHPVDHQGKLLVQYSLPDTTCTINDFSVEYGQDESRILELLSHLELTSKEIIARLGLAWTPAKMTQYLKQHDRIEVIKKSPLRFRLKNAKRELTLFD